MCVSQCMLTEIDPGVERERGEVSLTVSLQDPGLRGVPLCGG